MTHSALFTLLWVLWIVAFLAIELIALLDRRLDDTLSEHVWSWCHVRDNRPQAYAWVLRGALALFMAWLSGHFVFGWWSL